MEDASMGLLQIILIFVLVLFVLGTLPVYPYSLSWGYYPSGGLFTLLALTLLLLLIF